MTLAQKKKLVAKAVKRLDAAADSLLDLQMLSSEHGVDTAIEERFADELRERANYWEKCTWWQK